MIYITLSFIMLVISIVLSVICFIGGGKNKKQSKAIDDKKKALDNLYNDYNNNLSIKELTSKKKLTENDIEYILRDIKTNGLTKKMLEFFVLKPFLEQLEKLNNTQTEKDINITLKELGKFYHAYKQYCMYINSGSLSIKDFSEFKKLQKEQGTFDVKEMRKKNREFAKNNK